MPNATHDIDGLLLAGTLYADYFNRTTGLWTGYKRLEADKLELKTPSDKQQKVSKSREFFGQARRTDFVAKPTEFSLVLDEINRDLFAMMLSGTSTDTDTAAGAVAGIAVAAAPGTWVDVGVMDWDMETVEVTNPDGTVTYDFGVDYDFNPRLGLLYAIPGKAISAGPVKVAGSKLAFTGYEIQGGTQYSHTLRFKLDGMNVHDRRDMFLFAPQATVSSQAATDFLTGKQASVPLEGNLEIATGYASPFLLRYS